MTGKKKGSNKKHVSMRLDVPIEAHSNLLIWKGESAKGDTGNYQLKEVAVMAIELGAAELVKKIQGK